jgi:hypothetical protein
VKSKARATGLGLLIGDGALNCREEKIIEGYYAYKIDKTSTPTAAISSSITRRTTPTADRRRPLTGDSTPNFDVGSGVLATPLIPNNDKIVRN